MISHAFTRKKLKKSKFLKSIKSKGLFDTLTNFYGNTFLANPEKFMNE